MAEPTSTRLALRRAIGRTARMKFYLRYPAGSINFSQGADTDDVSDTETFYCNKLAQGEGAWENSYIYVTSTDSNIDGFERRIANFNADADGMFLEWPADTDEVPSSDDSFELLDIWPPSQVHEAINDAIEDSYRTYPDVVTDEALVVEEDKRAYDISGLAVTPYRILQVYVERSGSAVRGQMTTVTDSDNFGDTTMDLSALTESTSAVADWRLGIYTGTGSGQLFIISAASTTTQMLTVATPSTTTPDTTSKYTLWNQAEEDVNWYPIINCRFDQVEHPNTIYMQGEPSASLGLRWRLKYLGHASALDADSDVTTVPKYFVKNKALANLHDSLVNDNRADRRDHSAIAEHHDQLARAYAAQNPRRLPAGTVWQEGSMGGGTQQADPLGWRDR